MKSKYRALLLCAIGLCLTCGSLTSVAKEGKEKEEKSSVKASIRPAKNTKKEDLPSLAKISFDEALRAARAAVPGAVVKAELEVEDGNLMYSFEIAAPGKKAVEVEIDAGDGKVLDIDKD